LEARVLQPLTRIVEFTVGNGGFSHVCPAVLRHDRDQPWTVQAVFPARVSENGCAEVRWIFGRELLAEGLAQPAGIGDVRVCPVGEDRVLIRLDVRGQTAELRCSRAALAGFLADTFALVPAGAENGSVDWDALAASWAAGRVAGEEP
jgi:hypothetical protein